jgi:PilZ domain
MRTWISRKDERFRLLAPVELTWVDPRGNKCLAGGTCINISASGMYVEVNGFASPDTVVQVRFANRDLSAKAIVRHCRQLCCWFRIGLEFEQTLLSEDVPEITNVLTAALATAK